MRGMTASDVLHVAGELEASLGGHRRQHPEEDGEAAEQREDLVLLGFLPPQRLELLELLGLLGREVVRLAEVIGQVVELPGVLLRVPITTRREVLERRGREVPGQLVQLGAGPPAVLVDGAAAVHLEVLDGVLLGASAASKAKAKLVPSIGSWAIPSTTVGSGMPIGSRIVGATSMQWVNCRRIVSSAAMRRGQATTMGSRVPPRWLAICLPHGKGVLLACARRGREVRRSVEAAEPRCYPTSRSGSSCLSASSTSPLKNVVSLNEPVSVPSMLAPLSPQT